MVNNWTNSYVEYIDPDGGNQFFVDELNRDIEEYGMPRYVDRLLQTEYITPEDVRSFYEDISKDLGDFYELCKEKGL